MIDANSLWLAPVLELAEAKETEFQKNGYKKDAEGFYLCPQCGTRVQSYIKSLNKRMPIPCECKKAEKEANEKQQLLRDLEQRRLRSFAAKGLCRYTFENDNNSNPVITKISKEYVDNFNELKVNGKGLLLYGSTGSGKTFHACCIGNALIDKGFNIRQTNFTRLESEVHRAFDKQAVIDSYARNNHLVIIDDLGVERNTSYMKEIVFNVIDTLYCENVPFIITTNLTADSLKHPADHDNVRIYQRILERCLPVEVENPFGSHRVRIFAENYENDRKRLGL